jgi:hypothetical protein
MKQEFKTKDLIQELVKSLGISYGTLEIKVHNGEWTNYVISQRTNRNETESSEILSKIKEQ